MPQVSIIIPSFNNLDLLQECIGSIEEQSFKDYEVFVIDANSTDGTLEYLQTLNAPYYWVSELDEGIYDAMNKGISMANGEWLYFLGSDDLLYNNLTLESIFGHKISSGISLIIGKVQYDYVIEDSILIKKNNGVFIPSWSNNIWIKNTLHHQGVFYRRQLFEFQTYNTDYNVLSDYDFNLKLFKNKVNAKMVNEIMAISKTQGISKNYNWQLYKEEIDFKTKQSALIFKPLFYLLGVGKYLIKKII